MPFERPEKLRRKAELRRSHGSHIRHTMMASCPSIAQNAAVSTQPAADAAGCSCD
jgi:hypothetical protein